MFKRIYAWRNMSDASNDKLLLILINLTLNILRPLPQKFYFQKSIFNPQIQQLRLMHPLQSATGFWFKYFGLNVCHKDCLFLGLTNIKLYVTQTFDSSWKVLKKILTNDMSTDSPNFI